MHHDRRAMFDNTNASPNAASPVAEQPLPDRSATRLRRLIFWASAAVSIGLITLLVQSTV
ncbi:hypothetical protein [Aliiroseovarius sp.]|uniref:hypothetical protein n=1 Tax=Aliiroseovarius sp. TaxID=1872442 RepID=UPI003BA92D51